MCSATNQTTQVLFALKWFAFPLWLFQIQYENHKKDNNHLKSREIGDEHIRITKILYKLNPY